jgi:hypothetical protein
MDTLYFIRRGIVFDAPHAAYAYLAMILDSLAMRVYLEQGLT